MLKKIVIIGATSAIAKHCARTWLERESIDLTLIGRDRQGLLRVASDLTVRSCKSMIQILVSDFCDAAAIQATVDEVVSSGAPDTVLIAQGVLPNQVVCQNDLHACQEALMINALSPVLFAEAFAQHMLDCNHGTLAIIGSVAGDRGRRSNYIYGAAKSLLSCYIQGLQHRFANHDVRAIIIKPGPTKTPMTAHLRQHERQFAEVHDVARTIVDGIERRQSVIYAPKKWRFIMAFVRNIPEFIFNRINL
jgi:hypothetical protein